MAGQISGVAVAAITAGGLFAYASIKGKSITAELQALVKGQSPSAAAAADGITGTSAAASGTSTSSAAAGGPLPASGGSAAANMALGKLMAAAYGWTGADWDYLRTGWNEESGWRTNAANDKNDPFNHAYGIPQSNPGTKMASAGADWKTSAATQIKWGLAYIKATYGRPTLVPGWSANGPVDGYQGY
jgi:hypothetical protein